MKPLCCIAQWLLWLVLDADDTDPPWGTRFQKNEGWEKPLSTNMYFSLRVNIPIYKWPTWILSNRDYERHKVISWSIIHHLLLVSQNLKGKSHSLLQLLLIYKYFVYFMCMSSLTCVSSFLAAYLMYLTLIWQSQNQNYNLFSCHKRSSFVANTDKQYNNFIFNSTNISS